MSIEHPAMPSEWPDWECCNAAELAFRSYTKWLKEHNKSSYPGELVLSKEDWQSLRKAVESEAKNE